MKVLMRRYVCDECGATATRQCSTIFRSRKDNISDEAEMKKTVQG